MHTRHAYFDPVWLENLELHHLCPTTDNVIICCRCCELYLFVCIITPNPKVSASETESLITYIDIQDAAYSIALFYPRVQGAIVACLSPLATDIVRVPITPFMNFLM